MKLEAKDYKPAWLDNIRNLARAERKVTAVDNDKMIEDEAEYEKYVSAWRDVFAAILIDPSKLDPKQMTLDELMEVKAGFTPPAGKTETSSTAG